MVLASTDGESHVAKLQNIAMKLMDDGETFISSIINALSVDEVYNLLNN